MTGVVTVATDCWYEVDTLNAAGGVPSGVGVPRVRLVVPTAIGWKVKFCDVLFGRKVRGLVTVPTAVDELVTARLIVGVCGMSSEILLYERFALRIAG